MKKIVRFLVNFLRKVIRLIIYPFRKPLFWFLLVLLIGVYCFPILKYKIAYNDVFGWYKNKIFQIKETKKQPAVKKGTDQLVYTEHSPKPVSVGRKTFGHSKDAAVQRVDVFRQQSEDLVDIEEVLQKEEPEIKQEQEAKVKGQPKKQVTEEKEIQKKETEKFVVNKGEYSGLNYLEEPVVVEGEAFVVNANEIMVDDTYMFLYGIYSNPRTEMGVKGALFLRTALKGARVRCKILARVIGDGTATADCFVGEDNINQIMVDKGFSKRVSTK